MTRATEKGKWEGNGGNFERHLKIQIRKYRELETQNVLVLI